MQNIIPVSSSPQIFAVRAGLTSKQEMKTLTTVSSSPQLFSPRAGKQGESPDLVIVPMIVATIGLPGRGKTYIARKVAHYLNWIGIKTRVFSLSAYRRAHGVMKPDANFFSVDNKEASDIRKKFEIKAIRDVMDYLQQGQGMVAVFDGANVSRSVRQHVVDVCRGLNFRHLFIESICTDEEIVNAIIKEVKVTHPDYAGMAVDDVICDYRQRIKQYETYYEPLSAEHDADFSYIRVFNQGEFFDINRAGGHVQSHIVYFLMNIHFTPKTIYICRHGESENNASGKLGMKNAQLTPHGQSFAMALATFMREQDPPGLQVWTSEYLRTIETTQYIDWAPVEHWPYLNTINLGSMEGMSYEEMKSEFPEEFEIRKRDKFYYRFPKGESYSDLMSRLTPVIMELERCESVLVVTHRPVIRCLLAYFLDKDIENMSWVHDDLPYLEVPDNTVIRLSPAAYGCKREQFVLDVPPFKSMAGSACCSEDPAVDDIFVKE